MKKLLVLALLGLGLGAGAWKAQHPEGTVEDFRAQAVAVGQRLKTGALAVRDAAPGALQAEQETQLARQSALEERLASLEETLGADDADEPDGVATALAAFDTSMNDMDAVLKEAAASNEANVVRLDAIDSRLELLVRRLDEQTVETDVQQLQETIGNLGDEVRNLQARVRAREETLDEELASLTERNTALGLRLDTLASTLASSAQPAAATAGATDGSSDGASDSGETSQSPNALASLSAGLDERFKAIESRLTTVNSDSRRIATLTGQLQSARDEIAALKEQNAGMQSSVNQLSGSIDELKTAGESLSIDTVQAAIRDQLALVQSQFEADAAADNTAALENLLTTTRNQITALEKRVQDLPASSTEASNAQEIQAALESQIVSLERRLESISSADPELANTLSNVQEKVDELASKGFVTQEDLRAQNEQRAVQYKIYFDRNSAQITDAAASVLKSFITQEKNRTTGVSIFGFTDRRGSAAYNQQLALQRATNVRSFLIQNGLDYTKIKALSGLGEDAAAAVLPDDADDAQQRVVVLYAAQK